jgi:hypothetical protein
MWYGVSLLFENCHVGEPAHRNLWEERILLVDASSDAAAARVGKRLGKAEEHEYTSATGDRIQCRFRRVDSVYAIDADAVETGTEVFSRFLRASEVASLRTPFKEDKAVGKSG